MCGIVGCVGFPVTKREDDIKEAAKLLVHRGPDDEGYYFDQHCLLGHKRYSVIDLSRTSRQPLTNEDGSLILVCNGEIYNYAQIKKNLAQEHRFSSSGDNEILLHLFEDQGPACFSEINGFFSLALWDTNKKELILARDHVGKRPLYYFYHPQSHQIFFASFLPALLKLLDNQPNINMKALSYYFLLGYIPSPLSIYENIHKLEPGQYLFFSKDNIIVKKIPTFQKDYASDQKNSKTILALLKDAVAKRTISDLPVGVLLSGGIDSTIISKVLNEYNEDKICAFSVGIDNDDDITHARMAAQAIGLPYKELLLEEKDFEKLEDAVYFQSEPIADTSFLPLYLLSKKIKQEGYGVVLTGDGADELFGGYRQYWSYTHQNSMNKEILFHSLHTITHTEKDIQTFLGKPFRPISSFASLFSSKKSLLKSQMKFDFRYYLSDQTLANVDAASMAYTLETRSPFLDHRLTNFCLQLPENLIIKGGRGKYLLREAYKTKIPERILNRKKRGFTLPQPLVKSAFFDDTLESFFQEQPLFHFPKEFKQKISKRKNKRQIAQWYNILTLSLWFKKHVNP